MGLGVFALLDGRTQEARGHFQDVLARDGDRAQARLMLAFIDGSLPASEHGQLCEALRTVAGSSVLIEACPSVAPWP
jgi:hypothetical protein